MYAFLICLSRCWSAVYNFMFHAVFMILLNSLYLHPVWKATCCKWHLAFRKKVCKQNIIYRLCSNLNLTTMWWIFFQSILVSCYCILWNRWICFLLPFSVLSLLIPGHIHVGQWGRQLYQKSQQSVECCQPNLLRFVHYQKLHRCLFGLLEP